MTRPFLAVMGIKCVRITYPLPSTSGLECLITEYATTRKVSVFALVAPLDNCTESSRVNPSPKAFLRDIYVLSSTKCITTIVIATPHYTKNGPESVAPVSGVSHLLIPLRY